MDRRTREAALPEILKLGTITLGLFVAIAACRGPMIEAPEPRTFIEWASHHAIPIESLEFSDPGPDLESIGVLIGSAQLVGLGESRHDTREQLMLKGRLVRHLIEHLGFRALILEESMPHAEALDRFVTSGEGDPRDVMNRLAGWYLWDTEEMLELVRWVRDFNNGRQPDQQVRVLGVDVTAPALGVQGVLDSLKTSGVDTGLDALALGLDLQEGDFWPTTWERYAALSDHRRQELGANYEELIETVKEERARIVAASSEDAYERMLLMSEIGQSGNSLFSSIDREAGGAIRESGMARTTQWYLDRALHGQRAILWAHNLHVAKSSFRMPGLAEGELEPMGVRLSQALGDDYIAIGGTFGEGRFPQNLPPGERIFETASEDVMDGALAEVGVPIFLLDLRIAHQNPAASKWLQQVREWTAQDSQVVLTPSSAFDLVYFVNEISRSQPSPLALQRYQLLRNQRD